MKKHAYLLLLVALVFACNKRKLFDGPNAFEDDFESYSNMDALFVTPDSNWSYFQNTIAGNAISVDTSKAHSGTQSIRFEAKAAVEGGTASKASIAKQKLAFWEGETMHAEAWYYLEGTDSLKWLFLMDLEEQTAIGAGPGIRLALVNDKIRVEHKYLVPDILQIPAQTTTFPRNQWVLLALEIKLSQKKKGTVKVWQDGKLIIEASERQTLPTDILYAQQGTKGMYSSMEFGLTANSFENDAVLFLDDIKFFRLN